MRYNCTNDASLQYQIETNCTDFVKDQFSIVDFYSFLIFRDSVLQNPNLKIMMMRGYLLNIPTDENLCILWWLFMIALVYSSFFASSNFPTYNGGCYCWAYFWRKLQVYFESAVQWFSYGCCPAITRDFSFFATIAKRIIM